MRNTYHFSILLICNFLFSTAAFSNEMVGGSISGLAWHDQNADGIQNNNEPLLSGIVFYIGYTNGITDVFDINGNYLDPITTSTNGAYAFNNLAPGTYRIYTQYEVWAYTLTNKTGTVNDMPDGIDDNDFNEDYLINSVTVTNTEVFENRNLGVYKYLTLGGTVWSEDDSNGTFNFSETGIKDISISLMDAFSNIIRNTYTLNDGSYSFQYVAPGNYFVKIDDQNLEAGSRLYGLKNCNSGNSDNDVDNDNNLASESSSILITLISGKEPSDGGYTNTTFDMCYKSDCNIPNPYSKSEFKQITDTICDVNIMSILCAKIVKETNDNIHLIKCGSVSSKNAANWFSFIAGDGIYEINIDIFGCVGGSNGANVGVLNYKNEAVFCSNGCTTGKQVIYSSDLIPGEVYTLFINGCEGSTCAYSIDITGEFISSQFKPSLIHSGVTCVGEETLIKSNATSSFMRSFSWQITYPDGSNVNLKTNTSPLKYMFPGEGIYIVKLLSAVGTCANFISSDPITIVVENPVQCDKLRITIEETKLITCSTKGYAFIKIKNATNPLKYILDNDTLSVFNDTLFFTKKGFHDFKVIDSSGFSRTVSFYIDAQLGSDKYELQPSFTTNTLVRGFTSTATLHIKNSGCLATNAEVSLQLPSEVILVGATPSPTLSDPTLGLYKWAISDLKTTSKINLTLKSNATADLSKKVKFKVIASPFENDSDKSNNTQEYTYEIRGSYDPNDISSQPAGKCKENFITNEYPVQYTIRFQNIGNFPATNVYVIDSLSPYFDLNSLNILASSHLMVLERVNNNKLKFNFQNINLVSKDADEAASNGFVIFDIKLKKDVPAYTVLKNKAAIYFDFNEAVITNEVAATIVDKIPNYQTEQIKTACKGESIVIDNITYLENTSFSKTYSSSQGCDSTVNFKLIFDNPIQKTKNIFGCKSTPIMIDGNQFVVDTSFTLTYDCDSIVNYTLVFDDPIQKSKNIFGCSTSPIIIEGKQYAVDTSFTLTYECDSIVNYTLNFDDPTITTQNMEVCFGSKVSVAGYILNQDTIIELQNGCDITKIIVDVLDKIELTLSAAAYVITAPPGFDSYKWFDCNDGKYFTDATTNILTPPYDGDFKVEVSKVACIAESDCINFVKTATTQVDNSPIKIFPNPTSSNFVNVLSNKNDIIKSIKLISSVGQAISPSISILDQNHWVLGSINVSGLYIMTIETDGGIYYRKVFVE